MKRRAIVWFRQDLRLHDNEALSTALRMAEEVVPVYIFDERVFKGETRLGLPKTGKHRARFILESVADLRKNLQGIGGELVIRVGRPETILAEMAQQIKASWVICNRERTQEEVLVQDGLEQKLWGIGVELIYSRGKCSTTRRICQCRFNIRRMCLRSFAKKRSILPLFGSQCPPLALCRRCPKILKPGRSQVCGIWVIVILKLIRGLRSRS